MAGSISYSDVESVSVNLREQVRNSSMKEEFSCADKEQTDIQLVVFGFHEVHRLKWRRKKGIHIL